MIVKSVPVRAAAALTGSNVTTSAVSIRGSRMVSFVCSASNATTLSAAAIEISNDGTNWVTLAIGVTYANGKAALLYTGTVTGIALNAGPAIASGVVMTVDNIQLPFHVDALARFKVSTAGTVNDFAVTAHVYYDEDTRSAAGDGAAGIIPF